jgi:hypothetical protein
MLVRLALSKLALKSINPVRLPISTSRRASDGQFSSSITQARDDKQSRSIRFDIADSKR